MKPTRAARELVCATDAAAYLGYQDHRTVVSLIRSGALRGIERRSKRKTSRGYYARRWYTTRAALDAYLALALPVAG